MKKLLRTVQVYFPFLLDIKFALMNLLIRRFRIPWEADFRALSLFPDTKEVLYLDVGANRGQSTHAILARRNNCTIVAFEPNPLLSNKLARNFGNDRRVVVNGFGLGNQDGKFTLYIPYYKAWMFDGLASLKKDNAGGWLKGQVYCYRDSCATLREVECNVKRLDDLGLAPFFITLDVQGFEFEALVGGEQTLKKCEPILLIESPDQQVVDYLQRLNYRFFCFEHGKFIPDVMGRLNTFFMTPEKSALVRNHFAPER